MENISQKIFKEKHVFVIAEIGNNHNGNIDFAYEMIDKAKESGVDCVKFQLYSGDSLVNKKQSPERNKHFKKFQLTQDQHIYLAKHPILLLLFHYI